ncbi:MAG: hypothetical protein Q9195_007001 [Heterodermia aff. obscurata]
MSGLEVIGVVASASQLMRYLFEIIDYTQSVRTFIRGASCPFQQHREHLESLISVVNSIRQAPLLQTSIIEKHLKALLNRSETLCATLRRYSLDLARSPVNKFWTALQARRAEAQILKDLASLERQKSNLLLYITTSHGIVLHAMIEKRDLSLVINKDWTPESSPTLGSSISPTSASAHPILNPSAAPPLCRDLQKSSTPTTMSQPPEPRHEQNMDPYLESQTYSQQASTSAETTSAQTTSALLHADGHIFHANLALNRGSVVNRSCGSKHQGGRRDTFEGNNAVGEGSAVLNGHASDELVRSILGRGGALVQGA